MNFNNSIKSVLLGTALFVAVSCNNEKKNSNISSPQQVMNTDTPQNTGDNPLINTNLQKNENDTAKDNRGEPADSMITKGMTALFGDKNAGLLKNLNGGKNMDSMFEKMQTMMGGKTGNPGDAMAKLMLNTQLSQLKDNNPLKEVANNMLAAKENGTAGPDKTYTASYTPEQPATYTVPVTGNGSTTMLQYTGGSITKGKKDGLWKNIYLSSHPQQWNVFTESYAELSAINMKVHATSLAGINENYSINLNEQYKKFAKQYRADAGKNEEGVTVQKIGNEKMFGFNCTHIKITATVKALGQTSHEVYDEWYSNEVPGAALVSPVIFENHAPAIVKKIIDAGCSGILVKSISNSQDISFLMQLSQIIKKDMPETTFTLPAGYTEDKNTDFYNIQ
ncbi:MAG: DUF4412 domain-containing protein [Bacteroidetes bacterium]|nr:DUF4412 domain-containing protein [Bacteroidota bacterium]